MLSMSRFALLTTCLSLTFAACGGQPNGVGQVQNGTNDSLDALEGGKPETDPRFFGVGYFETEDQRTCNVTLISANQAVTAASCVQGSGSGALSPVFFTDPNRHYVSIYNISYYSLTSANEALLMLDGNVTLDSAKSAPVYAVYKPASGSISQTFDGELAGYGGTSGNSNNFGILYEGTQVFSIGASGVTLQGNDTAAKGQATNELGSPLFYSTSSGAPLQLIGVAYAPGKDTITYLAAGKLSTTGTQCKNQTTEVLADNSTVDCADSGSGPLCYDPTHGTATCVSLDSSMISTVNVDAFYTSSTNDLGGKRELQASTGAVKDQQYVWTVDQLAAGHAAQFSTELHDAGGNKCANLSHFNSIAFGIAATGNGAIEVGLAEAKVVDGKCTLTGAVSYASQGIIPTGSMFAARVSIKELTASGKEFGALVFRSVQDKQVVTLEKIQLSARSN